MVGRDQHRSPADCDRTLAAIEIDIRVARELVRALARRRPASGEGRAVALGRRRQGPDRRLTRREGAPLATLDAALATAAPAERVRLRSEPRQSAEGLEGEPSKRLPTTTLTETPQQSR
jgi:hypothetical protein